MKNRDNKGRFVKGHKPYRPKRERLCNLCGKSYMPKDLRSFYCPECRKIKIDGYKKKYSHSERAKRKRRKWFHQEENRPKYWAHFSVNYRVRKSIIKKPKRCEMCDRKSSKLYGHHYLGYSNEHRLDVQWLCSLCHDKVHKGVMPV